MIHVQDQGCLFDLKKKSKGASAFKLCMERRSELRRDCKKRRKSHQVFSGPLGIEHRCSLTTAAVL